MMQEYFKNLADGIEAKLQENPTSPNSRKRYALQVARLGQRLFSKTNRVAWCGVAVPFDILNCMGITSCYVEFVGAMLATSGMIHPFLEQAEQNGYASDTCGYHRAVIGATLQGLMPIPNFLIGTSCPCSGGLATLENLARTFKKDLFVLHIPQEPTHSNIAYLAGQIQEMVNFISRHTGEKLTKEKLREAIRHTNKTREVMLELYALASHVPSPVSGKDLGNFGIVIPLFFGTPEATIIAEAYRDEFKNRIENKISGVPGEKLRLMWIQNRIQFKNPIIDLLEKEFNASVVVDEFNSILWEPLDENDPYVSMARKAISIPMNGPTTVRAENLKNLAQRYRVHGALNPCHWGCRQGTGARGLIEKELKSIGVPVLNLEVDCVDSRNFAEGQLKTRIEAFIEMLGP